MDEISLFAELKPPPPGEAEEIRARARGRLADAFGYAGTPTGAGLASAGRPRNRRRMVLGLAVAGAAAAAAIVAPIVAPSGGATAFATANYSVQPHSDGTVTVTLMQLRDPAGLQHALRADGIAAYVRYVPADRACVYQQQGPGNSGQVIRDVLSGPTARTSHSTVFVIHPAKLPPGDVLLIQAFADRSARPAPGSQAREPVSQVAWATVLGNDYPPVCAPPPAGKR